MKDRKTCSSGKTQHASAADARAEISGARRRGLGPRRGAEHRRVGGPVKVLPYRCTECDYWHVGHDAMNSRRKR